MKYIISLVLFFNFAYSSMLLDKSYPLCIEDYYIKSGALYYLKSSNNNWSSTTSNNQVKNIYYGYDYNSSTNECNPQKYKIDLGLSYFDFHALLALSGLLFSSILFYVISSFLIGL